MNFLRRRLKGYTAAFLSLILLMGAVPLEVMAADPKMTVAWPSNSAEYNIDGYPRNLSRPGNKNAKEGTEIKLEKIPADNYIKNDRKSDDGSHRFYYIWDKWIDKSTGGTVGTVNPDDGSQTFKMPASGITVVPTWVIKEYNTITYQWDASAPADASKLSLPEGVPIGNMSNLNKTVYREGDTVPVDSTVYKDIVTENADGSRTRYHFEGWKTTDAAIDTTANTFVMPDKAVTLTGSWSREDVYKID